MDQLPMKIEQMHTFSESFITEDEIIQEARARGVELGSNEASTGTGATLKFLAAALQSKAIVEVGCGSAVGTLWLLRGCDENSVITSIDAEAEHLQMARAALEDEDVASNRVRLINGEGSEILRRLTDEGYDMVVLREIGSEHLVEDAYRILRPGGALVIDHAMRDGKVADLSQRDEVTVSLREAIRGVRSDRERWLTLLLPVGDGLLVALKAPSKLS